MAIGTRPRATPESNGGPAVGSGYLLKRLLLGKPLATARLEHERLGKPTALAVFSSDNMSSVAYATEEILRILIPAVGIVAFTLVMPITLAVILVEAILIFSYRQTIKAYPSAGGAYIVTKDNFGLLTAHRSDGDAEPPHRQLALKVAEPPRAVLVVEMPALLDLLDRGLDRAGSVQRVLVEEHVEIRAELVQAALHLVEHLRLQRHRAGDGG